MAIIKYTLDFSKKAWTKNMKLFRDISFENVASNINYTDLFKEYNNIYDDIQKIHKELDNSNLSCDILLNKLISLYKDFYFTRKKIKQMQRECVCEFYFFSKGKKEDTFKCIHCGCTFEEA